MENYFFVRNTRRNEKMDPARIVYIEACKNYVKIHTVERIYCILTTLKRLEEVLSPKKFIRIHQSYIVSIDRMIAIDLHLVYLPGKDIPIGEQFRCRLEQFVVIAQREAAAFEEL